IWHLVYLLNARLVVIAVDVHRLQQLVEVLHHSMKASSQRTGAGRTFSVLTYGDHSIALVFQLRVLLWQRLALGLRLLTIAYPLRSSGFEQALGVVRFRSLLF